MISFNKTLSSSAFEGKTVDVGCGTIKVLFAEMTDLQKKITLRMKAETGFASVMEYKAFAIKEKHEKSFIQKTEAELFEQINKITNEEFVNTCIIDSDCEDVNGKKVTLQQIRDELIKKENILQLHEIVEVSHAPLQFLKKIEDEAKNNLKNS